VTSTTWRSLKNSQILVLRFSVTACFLLTAVVAQQSTQLPGGTNLSSWSTNGPAIFRIPDPAHPLNALPVFDHYRPESLNNLIWTNIIGLTNGRSINIWSVRSHTEGWPAKPPVVQWNTNCLMWGMKGLTALSPCWEDEGSSGQVPITALTKRHGYTRGHGMGSDGFTTNRNGKKIWFVTTNNMVVQTTVRRAVVRTWAGGAKRDYTIVLFNEDLPGSIQPMRVFPVSELDKKYPRQDGAPYPFFETEQTGNVGARIPGFSSNTWKGGDSGSPNILAMPNELIFTSGRSTSGPSAEMQADMDALCRSEKLDPRKYQLQWVDLSSFPSY